MLKHLLILAAILCSVPAFAAEQPPTDENVLFHAIGESIARSLFVFNLSPAEMAMVQQGIVDGYSGRKSDLDIAATNARIKELATARRKIRGDQQAGAGREFLEKAARRPGAVKTESGMVYTILTEGKGDSPRADDVVKVQYRGTLIDGTEFDNSYKRGKPLEFKLSNVIACWVEGVQKLRPGGKAAFVCPPGLAYGDTGSGEMILPNATLSFEVELFEVTKSPAAELQPSSPGPHRSVGEKERTAPAVKPAPPAGK